MNAPLPPPVPHEPQIDFTLPKWDTDIYDPLLFYSDIMEEHIVNSLNEKK